MSDPGTGFITCQCGTGKVEEDGVSRNCPVCDGDPRITLETIKEYARQVDSFSKENAELRSAYQRSRVHSCRLTKRIEKLERQLQSARELAEMANKIMVYHNETDEDYIHDVKAKAREFLKLLEGE